MDCTDIVIGAARGNQYRVFDYYTRDRSTPRMDEFYGGTQGITAAIGEERNGITTIIFRKKLVSSKYCMCRVDIIMNKCDQNWKRHKILITINLAFIVM